MKRAQPGDKSVTQLEPIDHIRLRPGMYVGGTDEQALHHLIYETVDNAVDEYFAGYCDHIWITLQADNIISIRDNGRGIPVHLEESTFKLSWLEVFLTQVGFVTGALYEQNFGAKPYSVSGGLHGVGIAAVNALSSEFSAEIARDGYLWQQTFRQGKPYSELTAVRELRADELTSTCLTFKPDFSIFEPGQFRRQRLAERSQELAWLLENLHITLRDERTSPAWETAYLTAHGLVDFVTQLNRGRTTLHPIVSGKYRTKISPENKAPYDILINFALQYTDNLLADEWSFINTVRTTQGGTHANALRDAITEVINAEAVGLLNTCDSLFAISEVYAGLTAVVSVQHPNPSFASPTKVILASPDVYDAVFGFVRNVFADFLRRETVSAKHIIHQLLANRRFNL